MKNTEHTLLPCHTGGLVNLDCILCRFVNPNNCASIFSISSVSLVMKVKSQSASHSVVSDSLWPVDCSPPGSSVHGILQARILEWVAIHSLLQGDLLDPGTEPGSPALQVDSLLSKPPGKPTVRIVKGLNKAVHLKCLAQWLALNKECWLLWSLKKNSFVY